MESTAEQEYVVYCSTCSTDGQGSRAQNIGARAGGPPSRSFLTNCGVPALLWKICIPDLADWQDSSRSPECSRRCSALLLPTHRSVKINQSSWGMGEAEGMWRGSATGGSWGGLGRGESWGALDWTGLARRAAAAGLQGGRHRHKAQAGVHVSAKNLVPPCATPPPCTLHLGAWATSTSLAPPTTTPMLDSCQC